MRRPERSQDPALARALFEEAPAVNVASRSPDGAPVLRALNVVAVDRPESPLGANGFALAFHGAPAGEKALCVGQPAVFGCERVVAAIPSWFTSDQRACPATTWYLSAQAHGTLEAVQDPVEKARILQALMTRFQPEGRHRPITAEDPMYAAAVRNLLVVKVSPNRVTAKASVGQDKPPEVRHAVLRRLWERGDPGDVAAIATALRFAPAPWPDWLRHGDARLHPALADHDGALQLLANAEWSSMFAADQRRRALAGGSALVGATVGDDVVGVARAVGDGGKFAWIADVFVREDHRGKGLGDALARLVLDHPAVRGCARVLLRTRIAEGFWRRHGFRAVPGPDERIWMARG